MRQDQPTVSERPLAGVRIAVLRSAVDGTLTVALRGAGATVIELTLVRVELLDSAPLMLAVSGLDRYAWLLIPNANAVGPLAAALEATKASLAPCKLAVVNGAAVDAVVDCGWPVALVPDRARAEGLVDAMAARSDVEGVRVLCLSGDGVPDALPSGLRALGAMVDVLTVYRSAPDSDERERLRTMVRDATIDLVVVPSTSALDALMDAIAPEHARRVPIACVGAAAARAARQAGFPVIVEADNPSVSAIMRRVIAVFGERSQ